jgi:hypothetical protein
MYSYVHPFHKPTSEAPFSVQYFNHHPLERGGRTQVGGVQ